MLGPNFDLQPMLMAPPPTNGTNVRKISKSNGMRNRQPSKSKQNATPPAVKGARRGADEGYDEDSDGEYSGSDKLSWQGSFMVHERIVSFSQRPSNYCRQYKTCIQL